MCKFSRFLMLPGHDFASCSTHCNIDWRTTQSKIDGTKPREIMITNNMLCKFRGLHTTKSWSGSLMNLHIETLNLNFGTTTMRTTITLCFYLFIRPRWIIQHLHVKPLTLSLKEPNYSIVYSPLSMTFSYSSAVVSVVSSGCVPPLWLLYLSPSSCYSH